MPSDATQPGSAASRNNRNDVFRSFQKYTVSLNKDLIFYGVMVTDDNLVEYLLFVGKTFGSGRHRLYLGRGRDGNKPREWQETARGSFLKGVSDQEILSNAIRAARSLYADVSELSDGRKQSRTMPYGRSSKKTAGALTAQRSGESFAREWCFSTSRVRDRRASSANVDVPVQTQKTTKPLSSARSPSRSNAPASVGVDSSSYCAES